LGTDPKNPDGPAEKKPKKKAGGQLGGFADQFTPEYKPEKPTNLRFADVLGIEEHMEELLEIVDFLQRPDDYIEAGARLPKGLLLTGAPGVGKTMLARALVGEANCSFFYAAGSEFNEVFFGMGAIRVKKLFEAAREHAPAVIFIDEIDALAGNRDAALTKSTRSTINQL
jgi:ATP-dependent metalloprotease